MKNWIWENRIDKWNEESKKFEKEPFEEILRTQNLLLFMALNNAKKN